MIATAIRFDEVIALGRRFPNIFDSSLPDELSSSFPDELSSSFSSLDVNTC